MSPFSATIDTVERIDVDIEDHLAMVGEVFRAIRGHDSFCVSYGVEAAGCRRFVKHSEHPQGLASLRRARNLASRARHPALPRFRNSLCTPGGLALVYDWVPGEVLWDGTVHTREQRASDPACPHVRFRALPVPEILEALDTIYDVHVMLADMGYVAVDLYDGCFIYDFEGQRMSLCDLDEYSEGPFVLEKARNFGSSRFMAPEEFVRGSLIDQVTNVYTLGRTAHVLLGDDVGSLSSFRGTEAMLDVLVRATQRDRSLRYPSVEAFVRAWRSAVGSR